MATHSSTLAWQIPWTEEPGRLQSMGSRRVGHNWATSLSLFMFMHWRRKWQPTPVFLPGESQGREAWCAAIYGSHRVGHNWSDLAACHGYKTGQSMWLRILPISPWEGSMAKSRSLTFLNKWLSFCSLWLILFASAFSHFSDWIYSLTKVLLQTKHRWRTCREGP